jgi:uncharacterized membrane protein
MMTGKRILIVGETWFTTATHTKGFDSFTTTSFGEGYSILTAALEAGGRIMPLRRIFPTLSTGCGNTRP